MCCLLAPEHKEGNAYPRFYIDAGPLKPHHTELVAVLLLGSLLSYNTKKFSILNLSPMWENQTKIVLVLLLSPYSHVRQFVALGSPMSS